jgi:D-alanine-D-alanine ligase
MKIALTCNIKEDSSPEQAEFDSLEIIEAICSALASYDHSVSIVEENEELYSRLLHIRPEIDIVFNIAEGRHGDGRESLVPCILDSIGIPYTGSGPTTLAITLNKDRTKEILAHYGVPTPRFALARYPELDFQKAEHLTFPLIVKPACEGSSKGITDDALVRDADALQKKVLQTAFAFRQNILIEEYLSGREFTVGILGNSPPEVLPIVELDFSFLPPSMNRFDSYESKWFYDTPENNLPLLKCPASLDPALEARIKSIALNAYKVLQCRDFCRMDLRLDSSNVPNIFDINALPGLMPDPCMNSRFTIAALAAGYDFPGLINRILDSAIARY